MPPLIDRAPIAGHKPAGIVCAVDAAVPAEQTRISKVSWCTTIRAAQSAIIADNLSARHPIAIAEAYRLFDQGAAEKAYF
jgi:hypothetical protein